MKILITGANGAIGKSLDFSGYEVLRPHRTLLNITNSSEVRSYLHYFKPEIIVHLAGVTGGACDKNKEYAYKVNVESSLNLIRIAQEYGLKRFIFPSSCAVYTQREKFPVTEDRCIEPSNYYGELKLKTEEGLLREAECELTIFRIFNVYGKGFDNSLINRLIRGRKTYIFNPAEYFRDYIPASEVNRFFNLALSHKAGVYNLGTGVVRSTLEVIDQLKSFGFVPNVKVVNRENGGSISWAGLDRLATEFKVIPESGILLT